MLLGKDSLYPITIAKDKIGRYIMVVGRIHDQLVSLISQILMPKVRVIMGGGGIVIFRRTIH